MVKVVVVIPAYNEARVIRGVVAGVRALGYETLVVDDGSTDDTVAEARGAGATVYPVPLNAGAGSAIGYGVEFVERLTDADAVVTFDADGQHDPADIAAVAAALDGADLVNGSRFLGRVTGMPWHRRALLRAVELAMRVLCGQRITDPCCGLKAFRPAAFKIRSARMAWACELVWHVARWGTIAEVPVSVRYTDYSLGKGQRTRGALRVGAELGRALLRRRFAR